ncbi:putative methylesterase 19 [Spatholobus suberectus]|nr:putative methylesterase 19 [Spatholobus suberectus]
MGSLNVQSNWLLCQNCATSTRDLTLALSLVRPFPRYSDTELLLRDSTVTNDKNGRVPKIFIISKGDNLVTEDTQMWMVERTGPFAEVKVINNSDHMCNFVIPPYKVNLYDDKITEIDMLEISLEQLVIWVTPPAEGNKESKAPPTYNTERRRLGTLLDKQYFILTGTNKAPILSTSGVEFLASRLYQLSPVEDLTLAFSLVRPLPSFTSDVKLLTKQTAVTKYKNGRVPKFFIISEKDNVLTEDFQRWIIESTGPFAEVKVIKDSDHMVMFSKPKKLSSELLKIAYKY